MSDEISNLKHALAVAETWVEHHQNHCDDLIKENAALREALINAEELERYSGDGRRQWGRCSAWLHPDDAVIIISAKAFDAARKEAQP